MCIYMYIIFHGIKCYDSLHNTNVILHACDWWGQWHRRYCERGYDTTKQDMRAETFSCIPQCTEIAVTELNETLKGSLSSDRNILMGAFLLRMVFFLFYVVVYHNIVRVYGTCRQTEES